MSVPVNGQPCPTCGSEMTTAGCTRCFAKQFGHGGGSAFPTWPPERANGITSWGTEGMSLRDYFAAAAIVGVERQCRSYGQQFATMDEWAQVAYQLADAMLAERSRNVQVP